MQQRQRYRTEEQAEDEDEEGFNDDPDGYIDPLLLKMKSTPLFPPVLLWLPHDTLQRLVLKCH